MSRQYASQLLFEVLPSKIHNSIIFVIFFIASFSIIMIDTGFVVLNLLVFLVLVFFTVKALKNNCQRQLQWQADGSWLIYQGALQYKAELSQGCVVTSVFTVLNFKLENKKSLSVLLFKDNINREKFRQLRVRIKVEGIKKTAHGTL